LNSELTEFKTTIPAFKRSQVSAVRVML